MSAQVQLLTLSCNRECGYALAVRVIDYVIDCVPIESCLHAFAAQSIEDAIAAGADVNFKDEVCQQRGLVMCYLHETDLSPTLPFSFRQSAGQTAAHVAAMHGSVEALEVLLAHRADPNCRNSRHDQQESCLLARESRLGRAAGQGRPKLDPV